MLLARSVGKAMHRAGHCLARRAAAQSTGHQAPLAQRHWCSRSWAAPVVPAAAAAGGGCAWRGPAHQLATYRRLHGASVRCRAAPAFTPDDIEVEVGLMVEGEPAGLSDPDLDELTEALYDDSVRAVRAAALHLLAEEAAEAAAGGTAPRAAPPRPMELSVVLCDDDHIRQLNLDWRGSDAATDVLSFEMEGCEEGFYGELEDEEGLEEGGVEAEGGAWEAEAEGEEEEAAGLEAELPVSMLGDVVISLDTAGRQALERGHSLRDECRMLLVHGLLHLLGYDHERGEEAEAEMAAAEAAVLSSLGWKGQGLIASASAAAAASSSGTGSQPRSGGDGIRGGSMHSPAGGTSTYSAAAEGDRWRFRGLPEIQILALDMDGTLLDSRSRVLPSSVAAIKAAIARGVTVMLATGKARPAAVRAMQAVDLAGDGLVVSTSGPGVFLQGLAAYGRGGQLVAGSHVDGSVVRQAFEYAQRHSIPLCGFLGEECVTLEMTQELEELHHRYYEPLARVAGSLEEVLCGPPLRKLLFMTHPRVVDGQLKPHWSSALEGTAAETMQAVPEMLEVVPSGWHKARALSQVLSHLSVPPERFMAVGDGGNDLTMVELAGVGVAMGNAVPAVKAAASLVVASNNEGGVAEAIERLIL